MTVDTVDIYSRRRSIMQGWLCRTRHEATLQPTGGLRSNLDCAYESVDQRDMPGPVAP